MGATVIDTSALIFLGRLRRLELAQLLGNVLIPAPVLAEFTRGRNKDPDTVGRVENWVREGRLEVRHLGVPVGFHPALGLGERAVLWTASELKDPVLLIDEPPARRVAKHLGFRVLSTPYLLLEGTRVGALTTAQAQEDLDRLVAQGYFLDPRLFSDLKETLRRLASPRSKGG